MVGDYIYLKDNIWVRDMYHYCEGHTSPHSDVLVVLYLRKIRSRRGGESEKYSPVNDNYTNIPYHFNLLLLKDTDMSHTELWEP